MYSDLYIPYKYVETEMCEFMALSVAYVVLKLVHCDATRYFRLECF